VSIKIHPTVLAYVHYPIGLVDPKHSFAGPPEDLAGLPACGDRQRIGYWQSRKPAIGQDQVPQAEAVHRTYKEVFAITQPKRFKPACELTRALLTIGDARRTPRSFDIFGQHPRQIQH